MNDNSDASLSPGESLQTETELSNAVRPVANPQSSSGTTQPLTHPARIERTGLSDFAIPLLIGHLLALTALFPTTWQWWNFVGLFAAILFFGQGINLGYHRLLAHRSLQVPKWLERFYVLLALCCVEETPGKWVSTHRRHHLYSDSDRDPHSPIGYSIWGHFGWLFWKRKGENCLYVDPKLASDVLRDPFYRLLERHWWLPPLIYLGHALVIFGLAIVTFVAFGFTTLESVGHAAGVVAWIVFLRTVFVWHITWSVNSLGHLFGYRNYETKEESRNNWFVALIASGEGWHNNHHHDPSSASLQHRWWEFDITYYQIWLLSKLGLAKEIIPPRHVRHSRLKKSKENS